MNDIALMLVVPGTIGGIVLAALLVVVNRRARRRALATQARLEPVSPGLINMAHIPIAGIGGLGMVAAAVLVAVVLPEAGYSIAIGIAGGILLATTLVLWRWHGLPTHERSSDLGRGSTR